MDSNKYTIPRYRVDMVIDSWKELCKRAKRLKVDSPPEPIIEQIMEKGEPTNKVNVTITAKPVKLAGWKLISKIDFSGGRPVVSVVPGETFRFTRRKDKDGCDHCKHNRRRVTCYTVEDIAGNRKQIGSRCVKDFLGHDPRNILKYSEIMFDMIDGFSEEGFGSGIPHHETLDHYLTYVACVIRLDGYRSRTRFDYATADQALDIMRDTKDHLRWEKEISPTMKDSAKIAKQAIAFCKKIKPDSSFLDNIKNIAINGAFLQKQMGFAAYIVQHFLVNKPDDSPDNGFFGTVGIREKSITAKVEDVRGFSGAYGNGRIIKFRTDDNKLLVWFATSGIDVVPGREYTFSASVKSHETYREKSQTIITRLKKL